jgi:hypothetical protein
MAVVEKKTKLIIDTLRDPHSRTMLYHWLYHYCLMLYVQVENKMLTVMYISEKSFNII